jgi:tetratricopeptide (TPR) repeat protein
MSRTADKTDERRRFLIICVCLIAGTLLLYAGGLGNSFVNYDDGDYVEGNAHVQAGLSWEGIKWAFTTGHASNWHPLTWLSHMLDCQIFGPKPYGPHAVNILLHAINTLLLFVVMRRMTGRLRPSAFVAALFGWHPVHVESVAWISERKDVLSTFFWLLTMGAYLRYAEEFKVQSSKFKVWYVLALVWFACGLMCKPMLVTLPFVLLLMDIWPLRRIHDLRFTIYESKQKNSGRVEQVPLHRALLEKASFLLLAIASSVVTYRVQAAGGAVASLTNLTLGERIANAVVSYLRYVGKMFWPTDLSVMYPHPGHWPVWLVAIAGIFLIGMSVGAVLMWRTRPYVAVGWFWFVGTLVPVIGVVQVGIQSMADRYLYVPGIGLSIVLAWGAYEWVTAMPKTKNAVSVAGGLALAVCAVLTVVQVGYWKNGGTLFAHVVKVTSKNYLAYNNLGYYLENHGNLDEALVNYQKSVEIKPSYEEAQQNYGHALRLKGRNEEAYTHLVAALSIKPSLVEAHNNLGNTLDDLGRPEEAMHEYREALRYKPDDADANNNLGIALAKKGKLEEAEKHLRYAVQLKPLDGTKHSNLGNALAIQNKADEAIQEYNRALELDPKDPQSHFNLGNLLFGRERLDEAAAHFQQAIRLREDNPEADYALGLIRMKQRKNAEALGYFREAVRLRPNYPEAQNAVKALSGAK